MDENAELGTVIVFTEAYSTTVRDEDIGKAGVFSLILDNNNGTFEISPAVAERATTFILTVRDNSLIDYETFKSLRFQVIHLFATFYQLNGKELKILRIFFFFT